VPITLELISSNQWDLTDWQDVASYHLALLMSKLVFSLQNSFKHQRYRVGTLIKFENSFIFKKKTLTDIIWQ